MNELLLAIAKMFVNLEGAEDAHPDEYVQNLASKDESFWLEVTKSDMVELLVCARAMELDKFVAHVRELSDS